MHTKGTGRRDKVERASDSSAVLWNFPPGQAKLPSIECWAEKVCNRAHTVLVTDWHIPGNCSKAVVDPEVTGGTVSQSVPQSGSLGDLRSIFPWLLQHIDTMACDKLIKNNFSQVFLLSITSSCWDMFWRETTFIKISLTETQGKRYVLCLYFIITSQVTRGNHVALSPSSMDSCSFTTFSNSFPCPAKWVHFRRVGFQTPAFVSSSLSSMNSQDIHAGVLVATFQRYFFYSS